MKSSYVIAVAAVIIVVVVAIGIVLLMNPPAGTDGDNIPEETNAVGMRGLEFTPASITVTIGTTVTWTNDDSVDHTVTSTSGPAAFDSDNMAPGDVFSVTFDQAGTYDYFCKLHPFMIGQVTVTA